MRQPLEVCTPLHIDFPPQPTRCLFCGATNLEDCANPELRGAARVEDARALISAPLSQNVT